MGYSNHYLKQELYDRVQQKTDALGFLQDCLFDGIWFWDLESPEHRWVSPRFWELLGYDTAEKKQSLPVWRDITHPDDLAHALKNLELHCQNPKYPYDRVVRYLHKNGSILWFRCRGIALQDNPGKPIRMLGAYNDITELKKLEAELKQKNDKLERKANYDCLTSLYNRYFFFENLEIQLRVAARNARPLSLLMIDVDHFKHINDSFGHLKGDEILAAVARSLQHTARDCDILARYGGEEFVVILIDTDYEDSLKAGERSRAAINNSVLKEVGVSISVGAATLLSVLSKQVTIDEQIKGLLFEADKALYAAKATGRNKVCHYYDRINDGPSLDHGTHT